MIHCRRLLIIALSACTLLGCNRKNSNDSSADDDPGRLGSNRPSKDLITIEGQVMSGGRPVPECRFHLDELKDGAFHHTNHSAHADKEGNYRISGLRPGKYRPTIYLKGENTPHIDATRGTQDFTLPPGSSGKTVKWTIAIN